MFPSFSHLFRYAEREFPGDDLWGQSCFNCATYPASVGLPIPEASGMLPQYLVKLLQDEKGARCGWRIFGGWFVMGRCEIPKSILVLFAEN